MTGILPLAALTAIGLTGCGDGTGALRERFETRRAEADRKRADLAGRLDHLERRSHYIEGVLMGRRAVGDRPLGAVAPAPAAPAPATPAAAPAGGAPRYGGELRLPLATDPPTLDPVRMEDTTSFQVGVQIMDGLVEFDADLNLRPVLAESWSLSDDRRTYTFRIKAGAKFHHGREVVAEDFVYSFARNLDPEALGVRVYIFDRIRGYPLFSALRRGAAAAAALAKGETPKDPDLPRHLARLKAATADDVRALGHPRPAAIARLAADLALAVATGGRDLARPVDVLAAEVERLAVRDFLKVGLRAPDPRTFVVELAAAYAPFLQNLPMVNAAVVPREEVERLGDDFGFRPVGAGAFRFKRWEHDVGLTLEAFDDYHLGRPKADRIRYRVLSDPVTQLTEFEIGNLDAVSQIPDEKYLDVKARVAADRFPGTLEEYPLLHVFYLGFNAGKPPFDDRRIRRALNHAVNKRLILDKVRKGRGVVAKGPLPPNFPAFDPDLAGYEYDLAKARALLAEAGYGPGNPLRGANLWFNTGTGSDANAQIAEVVQSDLRQVGVELGLKSMAWGTYLDLVHRCEPEFFRLAWLPSHPNGDGLLYALFRTGSASNATCYSNADVDRLLDKARSTHDDAARIALYRRAQEKIVADAAWIPLYHATEAFVRGPKLRGVVLNARGMVGLRWRDAWLAE